MNEQRIVLRQRRDLSEIIQAALHLYQRNFAALFVIAAVVVPLGIASATLAPDPVGFGETYNVDGELFAFLGITLLQFPVILIAAAAIVTALTLIDRGGEPMFSEVYDAAFERFWTLLGAFLRAIGIVLLLSVTVIGLPWAIQRAVRWLFVGQAVVLDGSTPSAALSTSAATMAASSHPQIKACPNCGVTRAAQWFCRNCGEFLLAPGTERKAAGLWRRFAAFLIDSILLILLLIIGWYIWFSFTAREGQTPGKKLVGIRAMRADGKVPGVGAMWLREGLIKGVLWGLLTPLSIIAYLWAVFDIDRQAVHDKIVGTYVIYHPDPIELLAPGPIEPANLGRWWRTLGAALVILLIVRVPGLIVAGLFVFAPAFVSGTVNSFMNALLLPFGVTALTLLYLDLQVRKESDERTTTDTAS